MKPKKVTAKLLNLIPFAIDWAEDNQMPYVDDTAVQMERLNERS